MSDVPPPRVRGKLIEDIEIIPRKARGLGLEVCQKYGYGEGEHRGEKVHVAPYYRKGSLVAQHLRGKDKTFSWVGDTSQLELFGQRLWGGGKRLVITEGELDCLSIAQVFGCKWPVASLPNGAQSAKKYIEQNIEWVESFEDIVLAFDNDDPGKEATSEVAPLLTPGKVRILNFPEGMKDANDMLKAGRGAELVNLVFQAPAYRPDGVLSGTALRQVVMSVPPRGKPIPYPKLDQMIGGKEQKRLYLYTAGSGIGKTTFVHELGFDALMDKGEVVGVVALEESPQETAWRYMGIWLNRIVSEEREKISDEDLTKAYEATVGNGRFYLYDHWGSLDSHNLIAKIKYMAMGLKCTTIILDHISIAISGMEDTGDDERKTIDRLMTNLRSVVEQTGVSLHVISHLKRPGGQGKSFNEGRVVSLTDLRGSASLEQLSDYVIALERDQQGENPNRAQVRVLKNRWHGTTGLADVLIYNKETGRLLADATAGFPTGGDF